MNPILRNTAFVDYIREDKSGYKTATEAKFYDPDNDFLIGESGGFLLNFNFVFHGTAAFSEMAAYHDKHKEYTAAIVDSPVHTALRVREETRRKKGYTLNCKLPYHKMEEFYSLPEGKREHLLEPLRITGEHYNFLNYSRILRVEKELGTGKVASKKMGFPKFFGSQYWLAKVREFAKNNGFNLVIGKSRRAGFSYWMGSAAANKVNLYPDLTVLLAAYDKKYLTKANAIAPMARRQLNWYENSTNSLFKRGMYKRDLEDMQLGFKTPEGDIDPESWQSFIPSVSFGPSNPDAAIGKDAEEIDVEELSNAPNLSAFMNVTEPTTKAGAYRTGMIVGFGTGGSKEGNWENFEEWFYHPTAWGGMPFENVWDKDARNDCCGYFKPYWEALEGKDPDTGLYAMDAHGNSNYEVAIGIAEKERAEEKKSATSADYIVFCGQYANFPAESFSAGVENMFTSPEFLEHIERVKHDPDYKFYSDGLVVDSKNGLVFKTNSVLEREGNKIHDYISDYPTPPGGDRTGCLRMWYPPFKQDGVVPANIYRISYDPVGANKDKDDVTDKHSLCSVTVRMIPNGIVPYIVPDAGIPVACWTGRLESMEADDAFVLKLCRFYNAQVLAEGNRGETYPNFRRWKALRYLARNPMNILAGKIKEDSPSTYCITIAGDKKVNGWVYVKDQMYTKLGYTETGQTRYWFHYILDLPTLLELQKFHPKKNQDRISNLVIQAHDNKAISLGSVRKALGNETNRDNVKFWEKMVSENRYD